MTHDPLTVAEVARLGDAILAEVGTAVVGMDDPLRIALATVLAGGHVLFEDVPGTGKTLAARSLATTLGLDFARLQCTPDLLPSDVTGSSVWDPERRDFVFRPGPVFTGLFMSKMVGFIASYFPVFLLGAIFGKLMEISGFAKSIVSAVIKVYMEIGRASCRERV